MLGQIRNFNKVNFSFVRTFSTTKKSEPLTITKKSEPLITTFQNFKVRDLIKLGYTSESGWICGFRNARLIGLQYDGTENTESYAGIRESGHTHNTFYYTNVITHAIETDTWNVWKNTHVHLTYDDFFSLFLMHGMPNVGLHLLKYKFNTNVEQTALINFKMKYLPTLTSKEKKDILLPLFQKIQESTLKNG